MQSDGMSSMGGGLLMAFTVLHMNTQIETISLRHGRAVVGK